MTETTTFSNASPSAASTSTTSNTTLASKASLLPATLNPTALLPDSGVPSPAFSSLALCEPLQRALRDKKYVTPSPIQAQAIPHLLKGMDIIGCAQTGTGKTAAFALPILHMLAASNKPVGPRRVRALILTPTRELATQITESLQSYGRHLRLTHTVVFGGVSQHWQVRKLQRGVDILVATPGRLLDLEKQGHLVLDAVEIFVLDEADRMLDLGFVTDVKKILAKLPTRRQSLLFSATMPPAIQELASKFLHKPVMIEVTPVSSTAERIEQGVCFMDRDDKRKVLLHYINKHSEGLVLVFVRMKHSANRLVEQLEKDGVRCESIHGNKSQAARERALQNFRQGRVRVMIATDIAARGIDVKGISLVVNFDLPEEPESYVHRIGRTARAGAEGLAISLCDRSERNLLRSIERLIRQTIPVLKDHPCVKAEEPRDFSRGFDPRGSSSSMPRGRSGGFGGPRRSSQGGGDSQGSAPSSRASQGGSSAPRGRSFQSRSSYSR